MKRYRTLALSTAAVLGLMISIAHAEGARFTSHHLVPQEDYAAQASQLDAEGKLALREYLDYEHREPCQNYRVKPQPFVTDHCHRKTHEKMVAKKRVIETTQRTQTTELRPVVSHYTIYFDFDKAGIRPSEESTLATVAREIRRYEPYEVTIVGHADRSGPADYNLKLSRERARMVSDTLHARGIPNRILGEEARGESDPAVPTQDGVKLQENRRVEIQFRK